MFPEATRHAARMLLLVTWMAASAQAAPRTTTALSTLEHFGAARCDSPAVTVRSVDEHRVDYALARLPGDDWALLIGGAVEGSITEVIRFAPRASTVSPESVGPMAGEGFVPARLATLQWGMHTAYRLKPIDERRPGTAFVPGDTVCTEELVVRIGLPEARIVRVDAVVRQATGTPSLQPETLDQVLAVLQSRASIEAPRTSEDPEDGWSRSGLLQCRAGGPGARACSYGSPGIGAAGAIDCSVQCAPGAHACCAAYADDRCGCRLDSPDSNRP